MPRVKLLLVGVGAVLLALCATAAGAQSPLYAPPPQTYSIDT